MCTPTISVEGGPQRKVQLTIKTTDNRISKTTGKKINELTNTDAANTTIQLTFKIIIKTP